MSEETTAPASLAEVVQPSTEVAPSGETSEGTGASEQAAEETEQQRQERLSAAGRQLAEQRKRNQQNAFVRLQQRADALEAERAELTKALLQRTQPQAPEPQAQDTTPKREAFDSYEAWIEAKAEFKAEQKAQEAIARKFQEYAEQAQQQQRQREGQALVQGHMQRLGSFAKQAPDFDEVAIRDDIRIPDVAAEELMSMEDGPAILYAIGKEPAIAAHLQQMGPRQQVRFLGQLSAALALRPPQVSKAPAPGTPVGGKSTATPTLENASYEDFVKLRRKQIANRHR